MPDRVSGSGISQGVPDTAPPDTGPAGRRRFTLAGLIALIESAGLRAGEAHGIRVFSGLLPAAEPDPAAAEALLALEDAAATYPALRDIAARLHVLGVAMPDPENLSGIERRSGGRPPVPPGK